MPRNLPRPIKPELLELGDTIEVVLPSAAGMVVTRKGVVNVRHDTGSVRRYLTAEGGVLLAWEPGVNNHVKVILHKRGEVKQGPLFEMNFTEAMSNVRERIA